MHHAHSPVAFVQKVPSAGGLLPYTLMACRPVVLCAVFEVGEGEGGGSNGREGEGGGGVG